MATIQEQPTTEAAFAGHEYLTDADVITLLRLDDGKHDPIWRLRNLIRYQKLPVLKRGRFRRFKRSAIERWLEGGKSK